jgi:hypothetical protein
MTQHLRYRKSDPTEAHRVVHVAPKGSGLAIHLQNNGAVLRIDLQYCATISLDQNP